MKILQFTPGPLINKVSGAAKAGTATVPGADFASALKRAGGRFSGDSGGAGGVISLENQKALRLPPPGDLGQAGLLLGRLERDIRNSTPEVLSSLHNLEGLIYLHSTR